MEKFTWKTNRVCPVCGIAYLPTTRWQIACSYECGYKRQNSKKVRKKTNLGLCGRCGKSLEDKRANAIYCSKTCKSMDHTFKHRSKTKVSKVARRRSIWKRDFGICYLCDKYAAFDDFHIDHLVPVSRGGDNSDENLATTHPHCNRTRGTRIEVAQLLKLLELRERI